MKLRLLLAAFTLAFVAGAAAQTPEATPKIVTQQFALTPDGTSLKWDLYIPKGRGPFPVVVVIHGGGFRTGMRGPRNVCLDLADAGFIAAAIDYRLDFLKNRLPTQPKPVYAPPANPNQVLDVQAAVNAARHPSGPPLAGKVTGWVGAIGGSSGAAHALWVAATGTLDDTRANAAALFSGPYQFDDQASLNSTELLGCDMVPSSFRDDQAKYCHTSFDNPNRAALRAGSPIYQVQSDVSPLDMVATTMDPITPTQIADLRHRLQMVGATNFVYNEMEGCEHSFDYWDLPYDGANPPETVAQQVIGFFLDNL